MHKEEIRFLFEYLEAFIVQTRGEISPGTGRSLPLEENSVHWNRWFHSPCVLRVCKQQVG